MMQASHNADGEGDSDYDSDGSVGGAERGLIFDRYDLYKPPVSTRPAMSAQQRSNYHERGIQFGADHGLIRYGERVYVLPLKRLRRIDYFHGRHYFGPNREHVHACCQDTHNDVNGVPDDWLDIELIGKRGYVWKAIIHMQRRIRAGAFRATQTATELPTQPPSLLQSHDNMGEFDEERNLSHNISPQAGNLLDLPLAEEGWRHIADALLKFWGGSYSNDVR
jgi:hypothetical protein